MPLSPLREAFCREYLVDHNGAAAARRAGYSVRTAHEQAAQLLAKVSIQDRIRELTSAQEERLEIKADDILRETDWLAHSDIGDILDFSGEQPRLRPANQISERARRCISSIKVRRHVGDDAVEVIEFKLWDKLSALEKLGKHKRLFTDSTEHTFPEGIPLSPSDVLAGKEAAAEYRRQRLNGMSNGNGQGAEGASLNSLNGSVNGSANGSGQTP